MSQSGSGLTWRLAVTIITAVLWLVFVLYWIGFLWVDFEVGQNIATLCISSVVFTGLNALIWTIWRRPKSEE